MTEKARDDVRNEVRTRYAEVAKGALDGSALGCCGAQGGCGPGASTALGYSKDDLASVPEGADMGLGCGNPHAIASIREGETVLDLGSGGGFDCFLAARQVGPKGHVIGVDMTPEMVSKARRNAEKIDAHNVEFRLGEIEHLPVGDSTVDVILSNCVINLSPDKPQVFREAFRVLRPGGRLAISDVVMTKELPASLAEQVAALTGCVSGAARADELRAWLEQIGFGTVEITVKPESRAFIREWMPGSHAEDYIASSIIEARKPGATDRVSNASSGASASETSAEAACCDKTVCCQPGAS